MMSEDVWDVWNRTGATRYPQDKVVQFCLRKYPGSRVGLRALDLGCGSGVHTVFLAEEGFDVAATDKSPIGIANTRTKLQERSLTAELRVESANVVSFSGNHFDLVVCVGIFDTVGLRISQGALARVREVLKPGGWGFFLFASELDDAVKAGNPLGFHGYTRSEVDEMFSVGFAHVWVDRACVTYDGGEVIQDEWIVTLQR